MRLGAEHRPGVQVSLVVPWRARPVPGTEVLINYGRKSNEELLLLYGEWPLPLRHLYMQGRVTCDKALTPMLSL